MRRLEATMLALAAALLMSFAFAAAASASTNVPEWWINHGMQDNVRSGHVKANGAFGHEPFYVVVTLSDHNSGIAPPGVEFRVPGWMPPIYEDWAPIPDGGAELWVDRLGHWTDGIWAFEYRARDNAGNTSQGSIPVRIDSRGPSTEGASGWVNGFLPYVLTATDQNPGAGVAATFFRVDQATPFQANIASPVATTLTTEVDLTPGGATPVQGSVHTIDFASVDAALPFYYDAHWPGPSFHYGNFEGTQLLYTAAGKDSGIPSEVHGFQTRTVMLDVTAPVVTVTGNDDAWHDSPVTLDFSASDAGSGVGYIEWSIDGVYWTRGDSAVVSQNGETTVSYRAVDRVGLVSPTASVTVKVSTTPPLVQTQRTVTVRSGRRVGIPFFVTSITPTALVKISIRTVRGLTVRTQVLNGQPTNVWVTGPTFRADLPAGRYKIRIGAIDAAGNIQAQTAFGWLKVL